MVDTMACLASLVKSELLTSEIIVIDNGSDDDSVNRIRQQYPGLIILETGINLGYAGGNNVGIRHALQAGADAVCILNNDVDFLEQLLAPLHQYKDVGIVTPLIAEMNNTNRVWALGSFVNPRTAQVGRLHAGEQLDAWHTCAPFEVDIASGAAMLIRREVLERVGLMDEAFFLYYEETDWCLRIREAGYTVLAVPASLVHHKVSATLGPTSPIIDYYMARNHLRLIYRHWHGFHRIRLLISSILRNLVTIAAFTVKPHNGKRFPNRNARVLALRDALLRRNGPMGPDVVKACKANPM